MATAPRQRKQRKNHKRLRGYDEEYFHHTFGRISLQQDQHPDIASNEMGPPAPAQSSIYCDARSGPGVVHQRYGPSPSSSQSGLSNAPQPLYRSSTAYLSAPLASRQQYSTSPSPSHLGASSAYYLPRPHDIHSSHGHSAHFIHQLSPEPQTQIPGAQYYFQGTDPIAAPPGHIDSASPHCQPHIDHGGTIINMDALGMGNGGYNVPLYYDEEVRNHNGVLDTSPVSGGFAGGVFNPATSNHPAHLGQYPWARAYDSTAIFQPFDTTQDYCMEGIAACEIPRSENFGMIGTDINQDGESAEYSRDGVEYSFGQVQA